MTYQELYRSLTPIYEEGEAKAVVRLLLEDGFRLSFADIACGKLASLGKAETERLEDYMGRLRLGEPVQYVLGEAEFAGRMFLVSRDVLIPRPETAELCRLLTDRYNLPYCALQPPEPLRVLDVGTGSGCIAVTLALDLWNSEVSAWDISGDALLVARENARRFDARVNLELHDVLQLSPDEVQAAAYDIIVSNPPYIRRQERKDMERRVLDFEPHQALFVPDEEPLLFCHAIARMACHSLKKDGLLAFEINPLFATELQHWLEQEGWQKVEIHLDTYGKQRFILANHHDR